MPDLLPCDVQFDGGTLALAFALSTSIERSSIDGAEGRMRNVRIPNSVRALLASYGLETNP